MLVELNESQTRAGNKVKYRNYKKREKGIKVSVFISPFFAPPDRSDELASVRFVFYFLFAVIHSAANIHVNFIFIYKCF